ncbi:MAG TPA: VWA domain-containing protein [Terriglobales bacterium]|nr:VWA domain-containing protein [Terriglobales bacterium]
MALWAIFFGSIPRTPAQEGETNIRVEVDMVQLNVAVMDSKGNYVTGLHPSDFVVTEDGIPQKVATFGEGNEATRRVTRNTPGEDKLESRPPGGSSGFADSSSDLGSELGSIVAGANVFILFDTSNYMYRGFVFAQDAIAEFVRSLDGPDRVAFYSYSRDLSRATTLTADRSQVLRGVRTTVAGDDAALYNALLMTVRDAGQNEGRKVVVVFSNGPDNASMVPPEDVAELAQSKGIPIYMISTREAKLEPVSSTVFKRMSAATGGEAYFAKTWREQQKAFASIRNDLAHLYSLSYYPQPNPNRGWRGISVRLVGERLKKCRIRTRNGYRPEATRVSTEGVASTSGGEAGTTSSN